MVEYMVTKSESEYLVAFHMCTQRLLKQSLT